MTARVAPVTMPGSLGELWKRVQILEAVALGQMIIVGQVFNDADIIAGVGFTVEWNFSGGDAPADGGAVGEGVYSVYFNTPFDDAPTVIAIANNNTPATSGVGKYFMSQRSVDPAWVVLLTSDWDLPAGDGGFNFFAAQTT